MSLLMAGWMMNNLLGKIVAQDLYITTLGICPLLVTADTMQTGAAIGMVYLSALTLISLIISIVRNFVPVALRLTAIVLVSATVLACIYIFLQFWFYELSLKLGIYVPLIAMNCLVLAYAEKYVLRNSWLPVLVHGLMTGMGILLLMIVIGSIREYSGLSIIKQAPGAFLLLACVIAGAQWFAARGKQISSVSA
jgi:Na+-translocating ferredoxin:NAD+ oxidoreductase RnfE subunit